MKAQKKVRLFMPERVAGSVTYEQYSLELWRVSEGCWKDSDSGNYWKSADVADVLSRASNWLSVKHNFA